MEGPASKEAKKQSRLRQKKLINWRSEESYKRYQEANGLIRRRSLRPKNAPHDPDKYKCDFSRAEFIYLHCKKIKDDMKLIQQLKLIAKQPWPKAHKECLRRAWMSYRLEELESLYKK